ncbi:hypothetical protein HG530_013114 [Fusarium avenaceum]|nr:hypothetical protein HG530_013114 [Fusarium avenaceum]
MALVLPRPSAVALAKTESSLEQALRTFRATLTEKQLKDLDAIKYVPDTKAVLTFTAELDAKRRTIKGQSIASRLYSILQCVRDFSSVVETFVSSNPQIAALIWGSIKLTMLVAVNFLSYFEVLTELFMTLGRVSPQFDQYQVLFPDSKGVQTALCDFHAAVIRCCQHVIIVIRRPWHSQLYNSLWQSLGNEFSQDIAEIENQKDVVDRELDLARTQATLRSQQLQLDEQTEASGFRDAMRRITGQTGNKVKDLSVRIDEQKARERRKLLLNSLSSHDYISPHRQNFGSGKTILTSSVVDHALTEKRDSGELIAFFFPRFDDQNSLKSETILRSIVRQTIEAASIIDDTLPLLETLMSRDGLAANTLTKLITKIGRVVKTLYIIIDGLDECEPAERRDLLKTLTSLVALNGGIKLFLSTRETIANEIRKNFVSYEYVSMDCSTGQSDIAAYVVSTIDTLLDNDDLVVSDPSLIDDMKESLIENADGMFLWAAFQLKEICAKTNDDEIRKSIAAENLPKGLTEIFSRALQRVIESGKEDTVLKLLPWVTAAARPMTLDELQESAMIEIGQLFSIEGRKVNGIHRLSSWFQGLVDIDEETKTVSFAHASIRHFFLGGVGTHLQRFSMDLDEADHYLGEICSTYLFFSDFQTTLARRSRPGPIIRPLDLARQAVGNNLKLPYDPFRSRNQRSNSASAKTISSRMDVNEKLSSFARADTDAAFKKFQDSHPFLTYASFNWFFHTKDFCDSRSSTWKLFDQILQNGHGLLTIPWNTVSDHILDYLAMMEWACTVAHAPLIHLISMNGAPVRDKKKMLRPQVAKVVSIPKEWDFNETASGKFELVWNMACHGQKDALEILLRSVDRQDRVLLQKLALFVSAVSGHAKLVALLLPRVFSKCKMHWGSGFAEAARIGDFHTTKLFLDAWVKYKGSKDRFREALYAAAQRGDIRIFNLFLSVFDAVSWPSWQKARMIASSYGHNEIVGLIAKSEAMLDND